MDKIIFILTLRFPWAVLTGWPSFNHVMDGFGMPLAMHCKVMGLYLTTALSESPEDLIVGGTRFKKKRGEERKEGRKMEVREGAKTIISGIKHLKVCIQEPETSKFRKGQRPILTNRIISFHAFHF